MQSEGSLLFAVAQNLKETSIIPKRSYFFTIMDGWIFLWNIPLNASHNISYVAIRQSPHRILQPHHQKWLSPKKPQQIPLATPSLGYSISHDWTFLRPPPPPHIIWQFIHLALFILKSESKVPTMYGECRNDLMNFRLAFSYVHVCILHWGIWTTFLCVYMVWYLYCYSLSGVWLAQEDASPVVVVVC